MEAVRILVIDDEPLILKSIQRVLRLQGWEIRALDSVAEAFEAIEREWFDVIIADFHLMSGNGLEVLLYAKSRQPDAVRILMTGDGDLDIVVSAVNEGNIYKYISKPWDNEYLISLLSDSVRKKQRGDERRELMQTILKEKSEWAEITQSLEHRVVQLSAQGVQALMKVINAKDPELFVHSLKVAWVAEKLGRVEKYSEMGLKYLNLAALFHDIGKIAIRDNILYKDGKLDDLERKQMNHHAEVSAEILKELDFMQDVADIVRQHHERYDGKGYPEGLAGTRILHAARILTVADIYVALREKRPYKEGKSNEETLRIIQSESGKALDPHLVQVAVDLLRGVEIPEEELVGRWSEWYS